MKQKRVWSASTLTGGSTRSDGRCSDFHSCIYEEILERNFVLRPSPVHRFLTWDLAKVLKTLKAPAFEPLARNENIIKKNCVFGGSYIDKKIVVVLKTDPAFIPKVYRVL